MKRYRQRVDGEWVPFDPEGHLVACCDCGLVHRVHVRAVGEELQFMAIRMPRQTAGKRAAMKRVAAKRMEKVRV